MEDRTLEGILEEMELLAAIDGDFMVPHEDADKLLCEALLLLGERGGMAHKIVAAYNEVGKWYS
jgi:hypothetical protein